jgi:hypothetical protein
MLFEWFCQETMAAMLLDRPIMAKVDHFKKRL